MMPNKQEFQNMDELTAQFRHQIEFKNMVKANPYFQWKYMQAESKILDLPDLNKELDKISLSAECIDKKRKEIREDFVTTYNAIPDIESDRLQSVHPALLDAFTLVRMIPRGSNDNTQIPHSNIMGNLALKLFSCAEIAKKSKPNFDSWNRSLMRSLGITEPGMISPLRLLRYASGLVYHKKDILIQFFLNSIIHTLTAEKDKVYDAYFSQTTLTAILDEIIHITDWGNPDFVTLYKTIYKFEKKEIPKLTADDLLRLNTSPVDIFLLICENLVIWFLNAINPHLSEQFKEETQKIFGEYTCGGESIDEIKTRLLLPVLAVIKRFPDISNAMSNAWKQFQSDEYFGYLETLLSQEDYSSQEWVWDILSNFYLFESVHHFYVALNGAKIDHFKRYLSIQQICKIIFPDDFNRVCNIRKILRILDFYFYTDLIQEDKIPVYRCAESNEVIEYLSASQGLGGFIETTLSDPTIDRVTIFSEYSVKYTPTAPVELAQERFPEGANDWFPPPPPNRVPDRIEKKTIYLDEEVPGKLTYSPRYSADGTLLTKDMGTMEIAHFYERETYNVFYLGKQIDIQELKLGTLFTTNNLMFDRLLAEIRLGNKKFSNYNSKIKTEDIQNQIQGKKVDLTIPRAFDYNSHYLPVYRKVSIYGGSIFRIGQKKGDYSRNSIEQVEKEWIKNIDALNLTSNEKKELKEYLKQYFLIEKNVFEDLLSYNAIRSEFRVPQYYKLGNALAKISALTLLGNYTRYSDEDPAFLDYAGFIGNVEKRFEDHLNELKYQFNIIYKKEPTQAKKKRILNQYRTIRQQMAKEIKKFFRKVPYTRVLTQKKVGSDTPTIPHGELLKQLPDKVFKLTYSPKPNQSLQAKNATPCTLPQGVKDGLSEIERDYVKDAFETLRIAIGDVKNKENQIKISRKEVVLYYIQEFQELIPSSHAPIFTPFLNALAEAISQNSDADYYLIRSLTNILADLDSFDRETSKNNQTKTSISKNIGEIHKAIVKKMGVFEPKPIPQKILDSLIKVQNTKTYKMDIHRAQQEVQAAWINLHDYLGRFLADHTSSLLLNLQRIAREQIQRSGLIYGSTFDDAEIFTVFIISGGKPTRISHFKEKAEGIRSKYSLKEFTKAIKDEINSLVPPQSQHSVSIQAQNEVSEYENKLSHSESVMYALDHLKDAVIQYLKRVTENRNASVSKIARLFKVLSRVNRVSKFLCSVNANTSKHPCIRLTPADINRLKKYRPNLDRKDEKENQDKDSDVSAKSIFRKSAERHSQLPQNLTFKEFLSNKDNCLYSLSGRILPLDNSKFVFDKKIDPRILMEDLIGASNGVLDLSDKSDKGSFITKTKWDYFKALVSPNLLDFNLLGDSEAFFDVIREKYGDAGDEDEDDEEEEEKAKSGDLNRAYRALKKKFANSKISVFETMCNKLYKIPESERAAILGNPNIPDMFISIVSPVKMYALNNKIKKRGDKKTNKSDQIYVVKPDSNENTLFLVCKLSAAHMNIMDDAKMENEATAYAIAYPIHKRIKEMENGYALPDSYWILDTLFRQGKTGDNQYQYCLYDRNNATRSWVTVRDMFQFIIQSAAFIDARREKNEEDEDGEEEPRKNIHLYPLIPISHFPSMIEVLKKISKETKLCIDAVQNEIDDLPQKIAQAECDLKILEENSPKTSEIGGDKKSKKKMDAYNKEIARIKKELGSLKKEDELKKKKVETITKILEKLGIGTSLDIKSLAQTDYEKLLKFSPKIPSYLELNGSITRMRLEEHISALFYKKDNKMVRFSVEDGDTLFSVFMRFFNYLLPDTNNKCQIYYQNPQDKKAPFIEIDASRLNGRHYIKYYINSVKENDVRDFLKILDELISLAEDICIRISGNSNICSHPIDPPVVRVSQNGKLFIDVPIVHHLIVPNGKEGKFFHPAMISGGGDVGMRDLLSYSVGNLSDSTISAKGSINKPKMMKKIKRSRRQRERTNQKIGKYNRKSQAQMVLTRRYSGVRQRYRSRDGIRRVVNQFMHEVRNAILQVEDKKYLEYRKQNFSKYLQYSGAISSLKDSLVDLKDTVDYLTSVGIHQTKTALDLKKNDPNAINTSYLTDRLRCFDSRAVFEDLRGFNHFGGDIFSLKRSSGTSWSLTGYLREFLMEKSELFGIPVQFISPEYTSKIAYYARHLPDPKAEAGYLIKFEKNKVIFFAPPMDKISDLTKYTSNDTITYMVNGNDVIPQTLHAPNLHRGLKKKILLLFSEKARQKSKIYVPIPSGKWVRWKDEIGQFHYLDRDINASLNLAFYNRFVWTLTKINFHENRGLYPRLSKKRKEEEEEKLKNSYIDLHSEKDKGSRMEYLNMNRQDEGFVSIFHSNHSGLDPPWV